MLIALPKGRLLPEIKKLFLKVGIEFDSDSRKLIIDTSNENFKVAILRTCRATRVHVWHRGSSAISDRQTAFSPARSAV